MTSLLACRQYSFSTRRPGGTAFEIQLPGCKRWAKCRDKEAVLSEHPRINQKTHGDEYLYGLLLQHLPWRDESQLLHPWDTAEQALLEKRKKEKKRKDYTFRR